MSKCSIFICLLFVAIQVSAQQTNQVAATPPMGWNSYNCFGSAVHEDEVKANAGYMAKHLQSYGWQYIVVDFLWAYDNPPGSHIGNPFQKRLDDGSYIPWLAMDTFGRLIPHVNKFPSAFGGKGFLPLSDYIHSLGLKFGIHVMRGIPRQAVWAKSPVLGTDGITADMIADTSSTCAWMNHMYGLDMSKKGAQEYLNSLLKLYASWDVDFIKVDDIARPYRNAEIEGYAKAIASCGRPVVLSISPGATPVADSSHVKKYANLWRMADDFWDNWKEIVAMMQYAEQWQGVGTEGHYPDCDMMQIGKLSKRGPVGEERYSRFTEDELYTHMNFWCIFKSPLFIGGNLPENRDLELKLETNKEALAVNSNGKNPREIDNKKESTIWVSDDANSKDVFVGMFNLSDSAQTIVLPFQLLAKKGNVIVRDLWQHKDVGTFQKEYSSVIPAHGSLLLRVRAEK